VGQQGARGQRLGAQHKADQLGLDDQTDTGPFGLACGPTGLVVIDCDVDRVTGEPTGYGNFLRACTANSYIPLTLQVGTPSGGTHFYFLADQDEHIRNSASKLAPKVDVRGGGGYVVAPGTRLGGFSYEAWDPEIPVHPIPPWLVSALRRPKESPIVANPGLSFGEGYAEAALRGEVEKILATGEGGRNHQLNESAYNIGQLIGSRSLDLDRARDILYAAARQVGLTHRETHKTLLSGFTSGARSPRTARG
jgi:hypothetical protein